MSDGLLLVDKPEGMTSHDVVAQCRKLLSRKDIGHAGTLDPLATGLLVLLVGQATKLSDYILNGDKAYIARMQLGKTTDTDDITGALLTEKEVPRLSQASLEKAIQSLSGPLQLKVPIYSAVKVKGRKLYEKARSGEVVDAPIRTMTFMDVKLLSFENDSIEVQFGCSKGSYVRAWVRALGEILGCGATMTALRRIHSSPYDLEAAVSWEILQQRGRDESGSIFDLKSWVPLAQTLPLWPSVRVEGMDEKLITNGQIPKRLERFLELEFCGMKDLQGIKLISRRSGQMLCLLEHKPPLSFKIRRVFPIKH